MFRHCPRSRDVYRQTGTNHTTEHLMQPEEMKWRGLWSSESRFQSISACARGEPGVRDSRGQRVFS